MFVFCGSTEQQLADMNRRAARRKPHSLSVQCRCPGSASGLHSSLNFDGVKQQARKSICKREEEKEIPRVTAQSSYFSASPHQALLK